MMMKLSSIILLIVLVSVFEQAQSALTHIKFETNMMPASSHTPALLSPEGYTLDDEALKAEILYSITESYFRMYQACYSDSNAESKAKCFPTSTADLATVVDTENKKFLNYSGSLDNTATIALLNLDATRKVMFCPLVIKHNLAPKCANVYDNRDMTNLDDTHAYKILSNWKTSYGDSYDNHTGFTTANFWLNNKVMDTANAQAFQTAGRNPGPELLVSAIMTAAQVDVNVNSDSKKYGECVTIVEYRNLLRHDAVNGESVEGPIFFVIGIEVRGEAIAGTGTDTIGGWKCAVAGTAQKRQAEVMILRVEGRHSPGFDGKVSDGDITKDSHFDGVGFPIWYQSNIFGDVDTTTTANVKTWIDLQISTADDTAVGSVAMVLDDDFQGLATPIDVLEDMKVPA